MAEASITLYEMSKQFASTANPMDGATFNKQVNEVAEEMMSAPYWMLLCRERFDFTVFHTEGVESKKKITKELMPTLKNRGLVLFIDKQPDGAWEIWVRDPDTNENFAYFLFDYTPGIIECLE